MFSFWAPFSTPSAGVTSNSSSGRFLSCPLPGLLLLLWSVSHYSCFDAGLASESCDFRRGWLWIPSFVATSGPVQTDCYRGRLRIRNKPKCEKFRFVRRMDGKWEPRQGEVSQWLFRAGDRPFKPSKLQKCRDLKRLLPGDSLYSTLAFGWWLQLLASQAVDSKRNRRVSPLLSSEGVSSPWRTKQQGF